MHLADTLAGFGMFLAAVGTIDGTLTSLGKSHRLLCKALAGFGLSHFIKKKEM